MQYFNSKTYGVFLKECPLNNWLIVTVLLLVSIFIYRKLVYYGSIPKKNLPTWKINLITLPYTYLSHNSKHKRVEESMCKLLELLNGCCKVFENERIFKVTLLTEPMVFLYKPETVEVILKSNVHVEKMWHYKYLKMVLGNGLITHDGETYVNRRKLIEPYFHKQTLKDSMPIICKHSNVLSDKLRSIQCEWINIVPEIFFSTFDIISEKALGISISNTEGTSYHDITHKLAQHFFYAVQRPWLFFDFFLLFSPVRKSSDILAKMLHDKTDKIIKENLMEAKKSSSNNLSNFIPGEKNKLNKWKSQNFLNFLIKIHLEDPSFSEDDIRDELHNFLAAGHDTIALAVSYAFYLIGQLENRNIQNKIHQELDEIFNGDIERDITWQDLTQMQYLECVLKETLRLYPSIPFFGRQIKESFEISDYRVEKGSICVFCPMMLHRDPESFPNPEKFDPERFLPENVAKRHPYAYIPFSLGMRKCIGYKFALMEGKAILASILRNFTVISKDPRDKVLLTFNISLINLDPLMLKFIPR